MILAVSGWREWSDAAFAITELGRYRLLFGRALHVRVGDAAGLDLIIRTHCQAMGFEHTVYYADWGKLGKAAGMIRNGQMLRGDNPLDPHRGVMADELLAFPQPGVKMRSPGSGTVGCLMEAHELGITVTIPGYKVPGLF